MLKHEKRLFGSGTFGGMKMESAKGFGSAVGGCFKGLSRGSPGTMFGTVRGVRRRSCASCISVETFATRTIRQNVVRPGLSGTGCFAGAKLFPVLLRFGGFSHVTVGDRLTETLRQPSGRTVARLLDSTITNTNV